MDNPLSVDFLHKAMMFKIPQLSSRSIIEQVSNVLEAVTVTATLPISGALFLEESRILTYSLFVQHSYLVPVEKSEFRLPNNLQIYKR